MGGGALGADASWINAAMRKALDTMRDAALDVRIVSYSAPEAHTLDLVRRYS